MEVITKRSKVKVSEYITNHTNAPSNFFLNVVSAVLQSLSICVSSVFSCTSNVYCLQQSLRIKIILLTTRFIHFSFHLRKKKGKRN